MSLRPFQPTEFDVFWHAVAGSDPTVAVGKMDPELLRARVATSGQMTERELLLAIQVDGRLIGSIQGYRDALPDGVFGLGIELFDEGDRGMGHGTAAVKELAARLFDHEGARRIEAGTATTTRLCVRCWNAWASKRKGSCGAGTRRRTAGAWIA